ncbi:MAG: restriction endonuclease subunit S [Acidobacteriaceae bacterium]
MKRRLKEVAELRTGFSFRGRIERDPTGDANVLQMKDFDGNRRIVPETMTKVSRHEVDERQFLRVGDVVFQSRGQTNFAAVVPQHMPPAILAAPMILIRCQESTFDANFAAWVLNEASERGDLAALAAGTSVKIISKSSLENFEVPVPPLQVQREIATIAQLAKQEQELAINIARRRKLAVSQMLAQKANCD